MTHQRMSGPQARQLAEQLVREGMAKLRQADDVYRQLIEQLPHERKTERDKWDLQFHLHRHWDYYSQAGQDKYLHETFFANLREGVFVDVGAFDGVRGSNTLFFERVLGWRGLCCEPSPTYFEQLQATRLCTCLQVALGEQEGEEAFLDVVDGYLQMSGLANAVNLDAIRKHPRHSEQTVSVPMRRLSDILDEQGISEIDYCSIDVEGAEMRVLEGIDFERHRVRVLSIEFRQDHPEPGQYLTSRGFRRVEQVGPDEIYVLD